MEGTLGNYSGILDGGKGVGNIWIGSRMTLVHLGIFQDYSGMGKRAYSPDVCSIFLLSTGMHFPVERGLCFAANSPSHLWFTYARFTEHERGRYASCGAAGSPASFYL
jgi:hypothetical protein